MNAKHLMRPAVRPAALLLLVPWLGVLAQDKAAAIDQGRELAFDRSKGNCLACHVIAGGVSPGNVGPPLVAIKARYPAKEKLRAQIWDAHVNNPDSIMPPYGRTYLLQESEIDMVTEFIWTL